MKTQIAVVGMGGIFPDALDLSEYWSNIVAAKDCIINVADVYPDSIWNAEDFFDPDPRAEDKSYSYKAGIVGEIAFDSMEFGVPPKVMESISVEQLFALVVSRQALLDANMLGPNAKNFDREKAGVIISASIGKSSYSLSHRMQTNKIETILRNSRVPEDVIQHVSRRIKDSEFEWNEESEPGFLSNVVAGRIASRFDLYGTNCSVDAACAGSLAALKFAVNELENGDCDTVLTGGITLDTTPFAFVSFCKTPALARSNISRPFDKETDGMLLGDGIGMMVLKRLEDAERDNDRIYGVIESISSSSDGRAKSIFAPHKKGQEYALRRAYDTAKINPSTIGMVEAHGTGTIVGDQTELQTLNEYLGEYNCENRSVLIGSVKSQIGHTRLTAGVASLMKTMMALYNNVLPPTLNVKNPNARLQNSPFYLTDKAMPWIVNNKKPIRRAGISSFGFGGTNFHVVAREYRNEKQEQEYKRVSLSPVGLYLHAKNKEELLAKCEEGIKRLKDKDVDYFNQLFEDGNKPIPAEEVRLGFVAHNIFDANERLKDALELLKNNQAANWEDGSICYREKAVEQGTKVVSLFSGQGSQYVNMVSDATVGYPELKSMFTLVDNVLLDMKKAPVSTRVYPHTLPGERLHTYEAELAQTQNTQPAMAAVSSGLYQILKKRGYKDDYLIGHSFGEITALWAAEALDDEAYAKLAVMRGETLVSNSQENTAMLAVFADKQTVENLLSSYKNLYVANENSDQQTIISGDGKQLKIFEEMLSQKGISARRVKVSHAFHSPYMEKASESFQEVLSNSKFKNLKKKIVANATAEYYPKTGEAAKKLLAKQMTNPVLFRSSIEKAYEDGGRIFIEIGPGKTLVNLTDQILEGKEHTALSVNPDKFQNSHDQLEQLMVRLKVMGEDIIQDPYFRPLMDRVDKVTNKSTFLVPPLHFLRDETADRIDKAINRIDPLPDNSQNEPDVKLEDRKDSLQNMGREKTELQMGQNKKPLNQSADNLQIESTSLTNKQMGSSELENAYHLQSLNGSVFNQFMQSQGHQLNVFNAMYQTAGKDPQNNNIDGLLHFIESFQSNSMNAYDTYFSEQKNFLLNLNGNSTNEIVQNEDTVGENDAIVVQSDESSNQETALATVEAGIQKIAQFTKEEMESRLIEIISEGTGYPEEMIETDMNIESDLGIDSIKRVEIFSTLNEELEDGFTQDDVEILATLYTIDEIAEYMVTREPGTGEKLTIENVSSYLESQGMDANDFVSLNDDGQDVDILPALASKSTEETAASEEIIVDEIDMSVEEDNAESSVITKKSSEVSTGKDEMEEPEKEKVDLEEAEALQKESEIQKEEPQAEEREIKRYSFYRKEIDLPSDETSIIAKDGLILITWDDVGLCVEIGNRFKKKGYHVAYVSFPQQKKDLRQTYRLRDFSAKSIDQLYKELKDTQNKALVGFIHVGSPQKTEKDIQQVFNEDESKILKAVFMFARYFTAYSSTPKEGKNFFAAVARMDGHLGMSEEWIGAPIQGGLFAMAKSLQREWDNTYCKAVDLPMKCENSICANLFMEEIFDSKEEYELSEIARDREGKRYIVTVEENYDEKPAEEVPGKEDVFLVTGGARGVTAACITQLAKEYHSKFIILGRSLDNLDLSWTKGETNPDQLKAMILKRMKETGETLKPVQIDKMIKSVQRQQEIKENLQKIEAAGGKVVYLPCDVTNQKAVQVAIADGEKKWGGITGLIHGAGVLADKNMDKKTENDFDDVFGTKVAGLESCMQALDADKLKYLVMFSSTAAYFGNQGQVDYAMANDVLNKFAYDFKKLYPNAFSLSINWGPWKGGMVNEALQLFLKTKGEIMIPLDTGAQYFAEQFRYEFKPESCQIMIAGSYKYISHDFDLMELL